MNWTAPARRRAGTAFVLLFFIVFALLCALMLSGALQVYVSIRDRTENGHDRLIGALHISGAVRRADTAASIAALADGTPALRVTENGQAVFYFCRDGYLYRQEPDETAAPLCKAAGLHLQTFRGLIRADFTAADGGRRIVLLPYAKTGGAE